MSKTNEMQIEKTRKLIVGLRKHLANGKEGVTSSEIDEMETRLNELQTLNNQCDALREQLQPMVRQANHLLTDVKASYAEWKKIIRNGYPQEQWIQYGLLDRR